MSKLPPFKIKISDVKNDLLILLSGLNKDEMKKFGKFVKSPHCNSDSEACDLFEVIKQFHPEFDSSMFTKQFLHIELYSGDKFVERSIRQKVFSSEENGLAKRYHNQRWEVNINEKCLQYLSAGIH